MIGHLRFRARTPIVWRGFGDSPPASPPLGSSTHSSAPSNLWRRLAFPPPTRPHCLNPGHRRNPASHRVSPFTLGSLRSAPAAGPGAGLYPALLCPAPAPGRAIRSSARSPARPGSELERQPEPRRLQRTPDPGQRQSAVPGWGTRG